MKLPLPKKTITELDVHAVRAVIAGSATPEQQRRAMTWIAEEACQMKFSPAVVEREDREILVGMQHVHRCIADMLAPSTLAEAIKHDAERRNLSTPKRHPK